MRDIMPDIENWLAQGKHVALATVVKTWGSAPRRAGAKMAVTADGGISGSVSGGCVEGAVFDEAVESLRSGRPKVLHFGIADETAWEVGLACGGSLEVFVKALDPQFFPALHSVLEREQPAAWITIIRGPGELLGRQVLVEEGGRRTGSLGRELDAEAAGLAQEALAGGTSRRAMLGEQTEVFIDLLLPAPTLVAVGGVHITVALAVLANTLGYRTVVIDPRKAFGSEQRFPHVDRLIQAWPEEAFQEVTITGSTAIAMLTHDPKLDDPALKIALRSPAFYIGALGSRITQAGRRKRLLEAGLTEFELGRLHAPIGLELAAQTPEEIALSILAEVVAARNRAPAGVRGKIT